MRTALNPDLMEFAGNLANELSNIVTVAYGNLSLLEPDETASPSEKVAHEGAKRALKRSIGVIERLRTVAGQQTLKPQITDLIDEIETLAQNVRTDFPPGVHLKITFCRARCFADIDREKFRGCLGELMANAADALSRGGILTIATSIVCENAVSYVRIDVCDNGEGMDPLLVARARHPMTTTKANPSHKGWGLALCEGFARQSGGFLEINSARGQGTCVSLFLPREKNKPG